MTYESTMRAIREREEALNVATGTTPAQRAAEKLRKRREARK